MTSPQRPDFFGLSDLGRVCKTNEDQFLIAELSKSMLVHQTSLAMDDATCLPGRRPGYLFLVADGVGGAPAGEEASRLAVASIIRTVLGTMPWFFRLEDHEEDLEEELKQMLKKCQIKIEADVLENPSRAGMGTTLTMAYVIWPRLYVVHVGDARAYLYRDTGLIQITEDHTVAQALSPSAAVRSPYRMVLWNVLGGGTLEVSPSVYKVQLKNQDVILLATDGLGRHVPDDTIAEILKGSLSAQTAATELVSAANEAGGRDNTTVVVARFGSPDVSGDTTVRTTAVATHSEESLTAGHTTVRIPTARS
jgi:serine/threonine protein phosphatase PrpC